MTFAGRAEALLAPFGLSVRGIVALDPARAPPGPSGLPARSAILVGHTGSSYWEQFQTWRARQPAGLSDPLDTWSREVLDSVADAVVARAVYPNDRPYLPFQQWAMAAEGLKPSPLGILMHPRYGLWHAWRGALLTDTEIEAPQRLIQRPEDLIHPCEHCVEKPCLSSCPVSAYSESSYDVPACAQHVDSPAGNACRTDGCLARNACPVGTGFRYAQPQQAFHMAAFLEARQLPEKS